MPPLLLCLGLTAAAADLHVVVAAPRGMEAGVGAGGIVLVGPSGTFVLGADLALTRREDVEELLPPETRRLDGDTSALVAYDADGARALIALAPGARAELPAPMRGALRVLLDQGQPALALVERAGWQVAVTPAGTLPMPAALPPDGVVPELGELCRALSPRAVAPAGRDLLVAATPCRNDLPAALLRWPPAGTGEPARTVLPKGVDLGTIAAGDEDIYIATRASGWGVTGPVGALRLHGRSVSALPELALAVEPPDIVLARDGSLWALALVPADAERLETRVYRTTGASWEPVVVPSPREDALRPARLLVDASGHVWVLARGPDFTSGWLLGEAALPTPHVLP